MNKTTKNNTTKQLKKLAIGEQKSLFYEEVNSYIQKIDDFIELTNHYINLNDLDFTNQNSYQLDMLLTTGTDKCMRTYLAFINNDDEIYDYLYTLPWNPCIEIILKDKIFDKTKI